MTDPEEERRLFYVGMTRAKEELILLTQKDRIRFSARYSSVIVPIWTNSGFICPLPKAKQLSFFD